MLFALTFLSFVCVSPPNPLPPVTKLQVSKSKRSITLVENKPIPLNCSVKSQTSPDSHFAVLWYVHRPSDTDGKLILKTTHNSVFEYGTYAEEEGLRWRLQFERSLSGGLFSLTVQRAQVSDSGSYYCHVEEWLLNPNHAWYKLAEEVSGRTEVTVKLPGNISLAVSEACLRLHVYSCFLNHSNFLSAHSAWQIPKGKLSLCSHHKHVSWPHCKFAVRTHPCGSVTVAPFPFFRTSQEL